MSPWQLEWLRLWRTRRLIVLAAIFLLLGFGSPVLTYFLPDLVKNGGNGIQIILPEQTAADGMAAFAGNIAQLGTLVVAIVAAATMAIDAQPGLAAFYRTRIHQPVRLVFHRYVMVTMASIVMLACGTLAAWYETTILLGSVSPGALMAGFALEALWLCFVTALVTLFASVIRNVLGVAGAAIGLLFILSLLGSFSAMKSWVPSRLSGSGADFVLHTTDGLWQAASVTVGATIAALVIAIYQLGNREL
jgi:ABC-2 type transport system permease protein